MDITPKVALSMPLLQRYGGGVFVIGGQEYRGSVVVKKDGVLYWEVSCFPEIDEATLQPALEGEGIEILIVGSGERQEFFSPMLRQQLRAKGVIVECMDTGAACRTFNILLQEDRKVAAALISI